MREIIQRIIRMNQKTIASLMVFGLVFSLATGVQMALAANNNQQNTSSSQGTQVVIESSSASVSHVGFRGTILEDVRMVSGTKQNQCQWVTGGWNSGHSASGGLFWFWDGVRAKICRNSNSPTGWVKVAGGVTGRHCFNPFKPSAPAPAPVVHGPVVMVESFQKLNLTANAVADVKVKGKRKCANGAVIWGRASARAAARIRITQQMLIQAQGNSEKLKILIKEHILAVAKAKATARLVLKCGPAPHAPPPQTPTTPSTPQQPQGQTQTQTQQQTTTSSSTPAQQEQVTTSTVESGKGSPEALPNTGPGDIIALSSLVSIAGAAAHRVTMRRLYRS